MMIMIDKMQWHRKAINNFKTVLFCTMTLISPTLNTKARYYQAFHKPLNMQNPKTLNEKILYLKLNRYNHDPLVIQCADKYAVREYVKECGCADILNELYGVYDSADQIQWDELPDRFVLKWSFGAGMNIICTDKSKIDKREVLKTLKKWGKSKCWLPFSEMQYKYGQHKIICEKYLASNESSDTIPDYKVYCFNGKPVAIFVMHDRGATIKAEFFDANWKRLESTNKYELPIYTTEKPLCFDRMMDCSKILAAQFPFVRCDYYVVNNKLIFGEMTFTPAGGISVSQTVLGDKSMGELLEV